MIAGGRDADGGAGDAGPAEVHLHDHDGVRRQDGVRVERDERAAGRARGAGLPRPAGRLQARAGRGRCEPEEGDRFTSVEEAETLVFEIKPIPGEPAWRPSDGLGTFYRVHVKRVTDEEGR
jgi:hypothetical protein